MTSESTTEYVGTQMHPKKTRRVEQPQPPVKESAVSTKKRKIRRSKGMPKRPLSAYNFFFQEERKRHVQNGALGGKRKGLPGRAIGGFAGLAREVAARWKELDAASRKVYDEWATREQRRYKIETAEYRESKRRYPSNAKVDSSSYPAQYDFGSPIRQTIWLHSESELSRFAESPQGVVDQVYTLNHERQHQYPECNYSPPRQSQANHPPRTISIASEGTYDCNDSVSLSPGGGFGAYHVVSVAPVYSHPPGKYEDLYGKYEYESTAIAPPTLGHPGLYFDCDTGSQYDSCIERAHSRYGSYFKTGPPQSPSHYETPYDDPYHRPPQHNGNYDQVYSPPGSYENYYEEEDRSPQHPCRRHPKHQQWSPVSSLVASPDSAVYGHEESKREEYPTQPPPFSSTGTNVDTNKTNGYPADAQYDFKRAASFHSRTDESAALYDFKRAPSFQNLMDELETEVDEQFNIFSWFKEM
jgi:hypothetical protein